MRLLVVVFSIVYLFYCSLIYAADSNLNLRVTNKHSKAMTQVLTNGLPGNLFYEKKASESERLKLDEFLGKLPEQLLDTSLLKRLNKSKKFFDKHVYSNDGQQAENKHQQILHYLLHQFEVQHRISRSKVWRKFSGWKRVWYGLKMSANNSDSRAYAEPFGMRNPSEDFIATAEHFIIPPPSTLEASIKCRMPLKYLYVKSLFPKFMSPLEQDFVLCRDKSEGILDDVIFRNPDSGKIVNLGPINEDTVTGFELLYATPGTGDASEIAGHLLLRVKLNNNPQAEALGIENPKDLVISFLANTDIKQSTQSVQASTVQSECNKSWLDPGSRNQNNFEALRAILQSLKGLSGGFLTLMDRQPLSQAIKNYTIEEDRDLLRYKLVLDTEQTNRLLEQLYLAKKNYNANYYFFYQNCASVLVKVIGMGIQSNKIAEFSPIVSPPNSLVALFIREGIAKPIRPAFYSYRKKAFLAQDLIESYYQELIIDYLNIEWPDITPLFNSNPNSRLQLIKAIGKNIGKESDLDTRLNHLFILVQEAEMAYQHKDLVCQQYTSEVTSQVRLYQRKFILSSSSKPSPISTDKLLSEQYIGFANSAFEQGVPHTKLLAYALGGGYYSNSLMDNSAILSINVTLDEQLFGSISNIAMQRSSYVKLASTQINFSADSTQSNNIQTWRFTALDVRKFKDRLNRVPSYFSPAGSMGLGLSVLDFEFDNVLGIDHGTWFGGELLFNLLSSSHHNDYIYTSIGADLRYHKDIDSSNTGMVLPARLETLWTFDNKRHWQWRNNVEYRYAIDTDFEHEFDVSTGLTYQLGEYADRLILFRLSSEYKYFTENISSQLTWIGIEVNPY